ncbi:VOC family protein [Kaistia dalseonensis]|uniref:Catechol 2,3-dioxygenase-like lactoylglutathione lyase family enzyme n=1 Tax=Kaistia dalseonensis TaxID=410840 RepID=A0ABU0HEW6_9HYPH|nr:VOC family protein [Kaistia dalseonensis]MCX5497385.1 VOC family protein [Kaistia dalseonensis]MDQ0440024.1 catechol 2,3-dioxygenase-like lactoylglutathione lyase family enzyme [Kaistia dalseonensis]
MLKTASSLKSATAIATVAVRDLEAARLFYEGTLGLTPEAGSEPGTVTYRTGASSLLVYPSPFAGTNQATSVTWDLGDDIKAVVSALRGRGVAFAHYDMPGMRRAEDIHVSDHMKAAWFKDPDGNFHALVGR